MKNIFFQKSFQRAFGTWPLTGADLRRSLRAAVDVGYRAIDTAQMYGNEADVGAAVAKLPVSRDDLCITTKVHPDNFDPSKFIPSVEQSLRDLGVDQVDVLLLHWPPLGGDIAPSLALLQQAARRGLARNIGVSNYTAQMMRDAVRILDTPLVTNQVEFHPLLDQSALLAAASETGVPLSSYCSVARGAVFDHPEFAEIGADYRKSAAQIALRWILQKGVSINTMSSKPENMRANFDVMDFTLSSVDMNRIDAKAKATNHRLVTRASLPWAPDWD